MKTCTISAAVALSAIFAQAAPAPSPVQVNDRDYPDLASLTFYGAGDAEYTVTIPANDSLVAIDNDLSVSRVYSPSVAICNIYTAQGFLTFVLGGQYATIAPPQPVTGASCEV